jgi:hypothetical protein
MHHACIDRVFPATCRTFNPRNRVLQKKSAREELCGNGRPRRGEDFQYPRGPDHPF